MTDDGDTEPKLYPIYAVYYTALGKFMRDTGTKDMCLARKCDYEFIRDGDTLLRVRWCGTPTMGNPCWLVAKHIIAVNYHAYDEENDRFVW